MIRRTAHPSVDRHEKAAGHLEKAAFCAGRPSAPKTVNTLRLATMHAYAASGHMAFADHHQGEAAKHHAMNHAADE